MSYDNNPYYGGGGGGGFVTGGGGSPYGSQDSPAGKKTMTKNQTIRPVTVKQVNDASQLHPDSDYTIDGVEVGTILMVGSVHNKSANATSVSYQVGDGTGYIDVRQWLESADDELGKMEGIEQDQYVAIMGTIKSFSNKRHVSATHVRLITDHNEIFHHFLKALYVSLQFRNPSGGGQPAAGVGNDYNASAVNGNAAVDHERWAALPAVQRKVMEIVVREDTEEGVHVSKISASIGRAVEGEAVMEAIETLMQEGYLFTTCDDLHVKAM